MPLTLSSSTIDYIEKGDVAECYATGGKVFSFLETCQNKEIDMSLWSEDIWNDAELAGMSPGRERAIAWSKLRAREIQSLEGTVVLDWFATLFPLRTGEPDGIPQYHDPLVPFIQMDFVLLLVEELGWIQITNHQDNFEFGLFAQKQPSGPAKYKNYPAPMDKLHQLPRDRINSVSLNFSKRGNKDKITFEFKTGPVILVAAETDEQWDGSLIFSWGDSSVCLFTSEEDVQSIDWVGMEYEVRAFKKARRFNPTGFFSQLKKLITKIGRPGQRPE